ncbi:hypothetical protein [Hyphococcus luteus]|uniref:Uncharacterized protein n=1 Tax=Hyphococcus luteus TaxID=2058213 RepID=A0A2S7K920_9PROT|nr:hypothetical protein [Marinicaulis flavus]PQA88978.1 hypothetical protein CW354_03240 [Marinicaulis flavus]
MNKEEWAEWEKLYKDYEEKRQAYESALSHIGGAFSEMARHYDRDKFDQNGFVREADTHEAFLKARAKLHAFIETHVSKA